MKDLYYPIYKLCVESKETSCTKLINKIMDLDVVPIHGPIHHFIMPATLLTSYNNTINGSNEQLCHQLEIAAKRAELVPGGNCASCGACGAALGLGQFASIITNNSPYSEDTWSKIMEVTSNCSLEIAKHGGPRCCKRDAYLTLIKGAEELERLMGIKIDAQKPVCKFFVKNAECRKERCLFYPKKNENGE